MLVIFAAGALVIEALDIGSLSIILPGVKALWHLSPSQVGTVAASSALGIAIGMIPAGRLADRLGPKRLLVGGLLWFYAGTLLAAASPNYAALVLLRGLSGLGMAPVFIMPYPIVLEFVSATTRTAFAALLETALGIGYLLPPLLGILVLPHFSRDVSWRIFLVIAGLPVGHLCLGHYPLSSSFIFPNHRAIVAGFGMATTMMILAVMAVLASMIVVFLRLGTLSAQRRDAGGGGDGNHGSSDQVENRPGKVKAA